MVRYYVYRNRNSVGSDEQVRLEVTDLLRNAEVWGGNDPGRLVRWNFDGSRHRVVRSHPGDGIPNTITIPLQVEPGDAFRGKYGFDAAAVGQETDGVSVQIRVRAGGQERVVLTDEQILPPTDTDECGPWNAAEKLCTPQTALPKLGWPEFSIDLDEYAGQSIEIVLETGPGPSGQSAYDWTGWADLRIVRQE